VPQWTEKEIREAESVLRGWVQAANRQVSNTMCISLDAHP
jgi:hypothetical protein